MQRAVTAEGPDLRVALAAKFCLHNGHDHAEVESVRHPVSHVHRCHSDVEVHRQVKIHGVVLQPRDAVEGAIPSELRVTPREINVLMGENEIDIAHVDATQRRESETRSTDARQYASAPERLGALSEDWSRRCRRKDWCAGFNAECFATACRADWNAANTGAERVGDERDQRAILGVGCGYEVESVRLNRGGIVRIGGSGEEERLLPRTENEKIGYSVPQTLRANR